jgi:hypothetical protein
MTEPIAMAGVSKYESTLLVLFIPSVDRHTNPIDQAVWEGAALEMLGKCFGGATALPKGRGVWRDDQQGGKLIYDEPIVIHCYTSMDAIRQHHDALREFLVRMGTETNQGAVGFVIERTYMEIQFPLKEADHG